MEIPRIGSLGCIDIGMGINLKEDRRQIVSGDSEHVIEEKQGDRSLCGELHGNSPRSSKLRDI